MTDKPNPFDVEALEKALNDSASRVSAIWITFIVFGLYLVITAGTITHRQLLVEDPVKLPVLNIDLPLVGFFFLAPILFVVLHVYVLIQVLLLARTATTYNEALDRLVRGPTGNAAMRQRLVNTPFAQIFAGAPTERGDWLGWLLRTMAWLTLAVAPVLTLLQFQLKSLPFHSHLITWNLRILIFLELLAVIVLWRVPGRSLGWRSHLQRSITVFALFAFSFALFAFSWVALTFPGEVHSKWTRYAANSGLYPTGRRNATDGCKRSKIEAVSSQTHAELQRA
jgi:hypothetical protein